MTDRKSITHPLVPRGTPREKREKTLRSWCRKYGYSMKRGEVLPDLDCPTGDPGKDLQSTLSLAGTDAYGYMLFDNRTGVNVLGGAAGRDGLGCDLDDPDGLGIYKSSLDDVEDFLGEIHAQVERYYRSRGGGSC